MRPRLEARSAIGAIANCPGSGDAVKNHGLTATEEGIGTVPHVLSVAAFQRRQLEYVVGSCAVLLLPRGEPQILVPKMDVIVVMPGSLALELPVLSGFENATPNS